MPIDASAVDKLAKQLPYSKKFIELLLCRGLDTLVKIKEFLGDDVSGFNDPFLLKGMCEAKNRIQQAIEARERVLVYGDYDCDGISSAAILTLFLINNGLDVYTHIPSRIKDGYGLNIKTLEYLIEEFTPDLIISCDCGVTAKEEVAHVFDLGIDTIITDHHEVNHDCLPECIVINPKQLDCNYPTDSLCGAGVAFKVVEACAGLDEALKYVDLAAVATIADMVPLIGENRLIVKLGLLQKNRKSKGLIALLKNQGFTGDVTSTDIAYRIAPRINAAGRMGDAYRAFELLVSENPIRIAELIAEIDQANNDRKLLSDQMLAEALEDLKYENLIDTNAVVLSHPSWEKGITGILAAQIAQEYRRPTFIVVGTDICKGTARGASGINIYELLDKCSDLLVEFGGHAQAAGFSIKHDNVEKFKLRLKGLLKDLPKTQLMPSIEYDLNLDENEISEELVRELGLLEPVGIANPRPLFNIYAHKLTITPTKSSHKHSQIVTDNGLSIIAFNNYAQNQFLVGTSKKQLIVELAINNFNNKQEVKATLRGAIPDELTIVDAIAKANYLKNVSIRKLAEPRVKTYLPKELATLLNEKLYGTLIIAGSKKSYDDFLSNHKLDYIYHEFMFWSNSNNYTRLIVSPIFDSSMNLAGYEKIIFLDTPVGDGLISFINKRSMATIYVPNISNELDFIAGLNTSREALLATYGIIKANSDLSSYSIFNYFKLLNSRASTITPSDFVYALAVFNELGLIKVNGDPFKITVQTGVKCDLEQSSIFNYIKNLALGGKS